MKIALLVKTIIVLFGFALTGCATTGSQQPPEGANVVAFSAPEIGTEAKWEIVENGKETFQEGVFTKGEIDGMMAYYWNNPDNDVVSVSDLETRSWLGRWSLKNEEWLVRAKPHDGNLNFPLWAGKEYPANCYWSEKGGWSGRVRTSVAVEDWETVSVPAGTYETLRIVQKNQYFKYIQWYAPDISMSVKFSLSNKKGKRSGVLAKLVKP